MDSIGTVLVGVLADRPRIPGLVEPSGVLPIPVVLDRTAFFAPVAA